MESTEDKIIRLLKALHAASDELVDVWECLSDQKTSDIGLMVGAVASGQRRLKRSYEEILIEMGE